MNQGRPRTTSYSKFATQAVTSSLCFPILRLNFAMCVMAKVFLPSAKESICGRSKGHTCILCFCANCVLMNWELAPKSRNVLAFLSSTEPSTTIWVDTSGSSDECLLASTGSLVACAVNGSSSITLTGSLSDALRQWPLRFPNPPPLLRRRLRSVAFLYSTRWGENRWPRGGVRTRRADSYCQCDDALSVRIFDTGATRNSDH